MPKLATVVDPKSEAFARNAEVNRALAEELRRRVAEAALGGPESARTRHAGRGKLLPRERVERLLDIGSPFLEIGQLAALRALRRRGAGRRHHHRRSAASRGARP